MDSCCTPATDKTKIAKNTCPVCNQKGKSVSIITLKSLLKAVALETIHPEDSYMFCPNPACNVVYFIGSQTFEKNIIKVPVFQKDIGMNVPVCYCFDWTRERLIQAIDKNEQPIEHIKEQVQASRCGCEFNNPQGACCLGNVTVFVRSLDKS